MPPIKHPLSPGGSTLAVLDANVLLPPRLSDLLFDLALTGLYHPRWTQTIEDEFIRHFGAVVLAQVKAERTAIKAALPDPVHIAKAKHRLHCFRSAVGQEYEVLLYDQPGYKNRVPSKVHAGDMHVASAALVLHTLAQEECAVDKVFIVSSNLPHLAVKEMAAIGIDVVSPGDFINRLNAAAPAQVEHALLKTIHDLTSPPCHKEDLLKLLITHGAEETAKYHAAKWNA
ncbi:MULTISPECIES: hypothetical protein [unclassified Janthinobacterium]|uniref:hypothetical protein n=1 Tax=unclassified Janthinobacterium TaxID=2610881 RepID=UPI0016209BCA|nr:MULTISPECIES: hypothetical protein [unclassified Janthinobacterium]MBB5605982.1 hypothetical protein [Janthinobacterium sp. S3T4]MBB5611100.1 hypothetical protein [Janthinobacterium sp. S3M3]